MQGYVGFEFCRADHECSSGNEHCAATITGAGVDGSLERGGVDGCAVALRSKASDVVDPRAKIVAGGCGLCGCRRFCLALGQPCTQKSCRGLEVPAFPRLPL